jgi:hypothetical protein
VGKALTISAMDEPVVCYIKKVAAGDARKDLPNVEHMVAPRIQHQVTYKKYLIES